MQGTKKHGVFGENPLTITRFLTLATHVILTQVARRTVDRVCIPDSYQK